MACRQFIDADQYVLRIYDCVLSRVPHFVSAVAGVSDYARQFHRAHARVDVDVFPDEYVLYRSRSLSPYFFRFGVVLALSPFSFRWLWFVIRCHFLVRILVTRVTASDSQCQSRALAKFSRHSQSRIFRFISMYQLRLVQVMFFCHSPARGDIGANVEMIRLGRIRYLIAVWGRLERFLQ
jgi:hypothetical protein